MRKGWLDEIECEYKTCGKPFMGPVVPCNQAGFPVSYLNGVSVYPWNAFEIIQPLTKDRAWDISMAEVVVPQSHNSKLFIHLWGQKDNPPTFREVRDPLHPEQKTINSIPATCALFHRCKDGTLIRLLHKKLGFSIALPDRVSLTPVLERNRAVKKTLTVRRSLALGDVLAATCVSDKLYALGYNVIFHTRISCYPITRRIVSIQDTVFSDIKCDVELDGAYETHPHRHKLSFAEIYQQKANDQLALKGISIPHFGNNAPRMFVDEDECKTAKFILEQYDRPWVLICPKSNSHLNRTVPDSIWKQAASQINGTLFWIGTRPAPKGIIDLQLRNIDNVIRFLAVCDLLVTVDTGPMHIAAALGTPLIAIEQASSPELHLSDQQDFEVIRPPLNCLNCQDIRCRLDANNPPCMTIDPEMIAQAANNKLKYLDTNFISAVIATWRSPEQRLNRCIESVVDQVDEVIVTMDGDGIWPAGMIEHPKVKCVKKSKGGIGVGRNINYGVRHSNGHWLMIMNDDVFLSPGAVQKCKSEMRDNVGIVSHLLFYPDGSIQHGGKYRNPGDTGGWGHIDHRARLSRYRNSVEQETVCGASMLVRRSVFYQVRGFDEQFMFYCEDDDFGMRVRQAGWKIMFTPNATGIHEESATTKKMPNMHSIMMQSCRLFGSKWKWYLEKNIQTIPGTF
jgi:GT2 family glycosyltransferase